MQIQLVVWIVREYTSLKIIDIYETESGAIARRDEKMQETGNIYIVNKWEVKE